MKLGFYRTPQVEACTSRTIDRAIRPDEIEAMRRTIAVRIPALGGLFLTGATCMYTNTPDKNFIIATHPDGARVHVACGFSGHGYKFCSVVGEIMADLSARAEPGMTSGYSRCSDGGDGRRNAGGLSHDGKG